MLGQRVGDIKAVRHLRCALDQVFSPAFVGDVADVLVKLSPRTFLGLVNLAGPTPYSRLGLAQTLLGAIAAVDPATKIKLESISLRDIPFMEVRPLDTSLNTSKLAALVSHRFMDMPSLCRRIAVENFALNPAPRRPGADLAGTSKT